jgi:hypothetical protein
MSKQGNLQGRAKGLWQGWMVKLGGLVLGGVLCAVLITPTAAKADATAPLTQLEYIRWLVQLAGATSQFSANSTAADYIQWARDHGMNPKGGWNPTAPLTRDVLVQTLGQFLGIVGPKSSSEWVRALEREGIVLPSEDPVVTRATFANVVDEFGFQTIVGRKARRTKTVLCPSLTPGKPPVIKSKCEPPQQPAPPKPPVVDDTPEPPKPRG